MSKGKVNLTHEYVPVVVKDNADTGYTLFRIYWQTDERHVLQGWQSITCPGKPGFSRAGQYS